MSDLSTNTFIEELATLIREAAKLDADQAITANSHLVNDLEIDSLDLVGVLVEIQDRFGIEIPEEHVGSLETVGQIADTITRGRRAA